MAFPEVVLGAKICEDGSDWLGSHIGDSRIRHTDVQPLLGATFVRGDIKCTDIKIVYILVSQ